MLTESSNIFQRLAVGWEQVDYEKTDASYKDLFTSTKNRMKNVSFVFIFNVLMIILISFIFRFHRRCANWIITWLKNECLQHPIRPEPSCQLNYARLRVPLNETSAISVF